MPFVVDYIQVDRGDSPFNERASDGSERSWTSSAQWALSTLCNLAGFSLEEEKRKPGRPTNILLGVLGDLSEFGRHNRVKFCSHSQALRRHSADHGEVPRSQPALAS